MSTCKDCLHYGICVFHLKGDENQKCPHYIADVVPRSEVQRAFEELYNSVAPKIPMLIQPIFKDDMDFYGGFYNGKRDALLEVLVLIAELKKKYVPDTNATTKVSSGDICVVCGEHVPEGRQICSMCETGQEFFKKRKE